MCPRPKAADQPAAPSAGHETEVQWRSRGPALNRVLLIGRVVAAPELRDTSAGVPATRLRLAINDRPEPEYHDIVLWRRLAEVAASWLTKGRLIYVEGRLHARTWRTPEGDTRRIVEIVAENLQILSPRPPEPNAG